MVEEERLPETLLYGDLAAYTSDEQKQMLDLLDQEDIDDLKATRDYWQWGLKRFDDELKERGLSDQDRIDTRLGQYLLGSSRPLQEWLKMPNDTKQGDFRELIEELKKDPTKYLTEDEIRFVESMRRRKAS